MKLYFAVSPSKYHFELIRKNNAKNVLVSYNFIKDISKLLSITENWLPENLMIDSGAFSVWANKGRIRIQSYLEFCKWTKEEVGDRTNLFFVNLDVLPGEYGRRPTKEEVEQSASDGWDNMEYLENAGIPVLPVFHQHEPFDWLQKMMDHKEYFGISPANDVSQKMKDEWLKKVFSVVQNKRKTHGFAVTSVKTLTQFPFYSADSSTWVTGGRYGMVPVFNQGKLRTYRYKNPKAFSKLWHVSDSKSTGLLDDYIARTDEGVKAFIQMEEFINKVWSQRNITLPA